MNQKTFKNLKRLVVFGTLVLIALSFTPKAYSQTVPSFPLCASPQGSLKVEYSQGTHGIVGSGTTYTGKDAVYTLSNETSLQCFCDEKGSGIQTNWWKIPELSDSQIQTFKNQGWIYVPNGTLWGLDEAPYLAQNSAYSCKSTRGGETSSSQSTSSGGTGGGEILAAAATTTQNILGLAATGNLRLIYGLVGLGLFMLLFGFYMRKRSS